MSFFSIESAETQTYMGRQWPSHFGDPESEYDALVTDRALLPLPTGRMIRAEGPDTSNFLQGMVSQDVHRIEIGASSEAWLLDSGGRTQFLIRLYRLAEQAFIIAPPPGMADDVLQRLNHYHIMEDLKLGIDESLAGTTLQGPNHVGFIDQWEALLEPLWVFPVDRCGYGGYDLIGLEPALDAVMQKLLADDVRPAGFSAWHLARVEAFLPWFGIDMEAGVNPVIYGAKGRISATKGCYIGQETVAMTRDRGRPPRVLVWCQGDGRQVPEAGAHLYNGDDQVATLTTAVRGPKSGQPLAIGTLKFNQLDTATFTDEYQQIWRILRHVHGD